MVALGCLILLGALLSAWAGVRELARTGVAVRPATAAEAGDPTYAARTVVATPQGDGTALTRLRALAVHLLWCLLCAAVGVALLLGARGQRRVQGATSPATAPAVQDKAGGDHVR